MRKYGSLTYIPAIGDEVSVVKDGTTIFGGVVIRIFENIKAAKILEYTVHLQRLLAIPKAQLVTERYETAPRSAHIITDLVTNYTTDGFTTTNVAGSTRHRVHFLQPSHRCR